MLGQDILDGANQYSCSVCAAKRDAIRGIELVRMPPTLCFQINRYVFDPETLAKQKVSSRISFPKTLDMAQFMAVTNVDTPMKYRLSAVLLHKGSDTNSGHYIARIYDQE